MGFGLLQGLGTTLLIRQVTETLTQTLGILLSTKGIEKLFPQSLVPTVRSTRWDSNKSQSPEKLIRYLSMYCELLVFKQLLYTLLAGLKGNPVTKLVTDTYTSTIAPGIG